MARAMEEPAHPASLDAAIIRAAARHGVPESLVRRIVMRESKYNARARNHAYWGLMQISYPTARSMGFHGSPEELLNPVVNLRYAVPYLANAFIIAGRRQEEAVRLYAAGYYYTARSRGLLGALRTADSAPLSGVAAEPELVASAAPVADPEPSHGIFGGLFGPNEMPRDAATQQVVYASSQQTPVQQQKPVQQQAPVRQQASVQPGPIRRAGEALPVGKVGTEVALASDKHGDLHPPKTWRHDGGTTVIARGEQAPEQIAAARGVEPDAAHAHHRHARKSTQFASLDAPTTAQAYAAAPTQDPPLIQADSQTAISQATAPQPALAATNPGTSQVKTATATADAAAQDASLRKSHRRHAHRTRHHESEPETAVAQQPLAPAPAGQPPVLSSDQQAAAAPETLPAQAPAQDAGAAAQAQFEQASGNPDAGSSRRHKRHSHKSQRHETTDVAAQSDAYPAFAPAQQAVQ